MCVYMSSCIAFHWSPEKQYCPFLAVLWTSSIQKDHLVVVVVLVKELTRWLSSEMHCWCKTEFLVEFLPRHLVRNSLALQQRTQHRTRSATQEQCRQPSPSSNLTLGLLKIKTHMHYKLTWNCVRSYKLLSIHERHYAGDLSLSLNNSTLYKLNCHCVMINVVFITWPCMHYCMYWYACHITSRIVGL